MLQYMDCTVAMSAQDAAEHPSIQWCDKAVENTLHLLPHLLTFEGGFIVTAASLILIRAALRDRLSRTPAVAHLGLRRHLSNIPGEQSSSA